MKSIYSKILDKKTGKIVKAYNFGGPDIIQVQDIFVYGNKYHNMTSYTKTLDTLTLHPIDESINIKAPKTNWKILSHQNTGTCNWRVTVKNLDTEEIKTDVYPFNLEGHVYELDCSSGTWVMASCGGKSIESSWTGQGSSECFRLKGTSEIIYKITLSSFGENPKELVTYRSGVYTIRSASPDAWIGPTLKGTYNANTFKGPDSTPGILIDNYIQTVFVGVAHVDVPADAYMPWYVLNYVFLPMDVQMFVYRFSGIKEDIIIPEYLTNYEDTKIVNSVVAKWVEEEEKTIHPWTSNNVWLRTKIYNNDNTRWGDKSFYVNNPSSNSTKDLVQAGYFDGAFGLGRHYLYLGGPF